MSLYFSWIKKKITATRAWDLCGGGRGKCGTLLPFQREELYKNKRRHSRLRYFPYNFDTAVLFFAFCFVWFSRMKGHVGDTWEVRNNEEQFVMSVYCTFASLFTPLSRVGSIMLMFGKNRVLWVGDSQVLPCAVL